MNLEFSKSPKILQVLTQNGLKVFTRPNELNIIGIRSSNVVSNKFDDVLHICYATDLGTWHQHIYPFTSDPGLHYLNHPINKQGTALLKHGQYLNAYKIGMHRGKYKALVQQKPVTVYRSKNSSTNIDSKTKQTQTGYFGINIHHAKGTGTTQNVDVFSAGCQVIANIDHFNELMVLANKHAKLYGNNFTYTLLDYRTNGYVPETFPSETTKTDYTSNPLNPFGNENILQSGTKKQKAGLLLVGLTALLGLGTGIYYFTSNNKHE